MLTRRPKGKGTDLSPPEEEGWGERIVGDGGMKYWNRRVSQNKQHVDAGCEPTELSLLHQCVVYLRVSRELDTASIALELGITPAEVERLENEARRYLRVAEGFDMPIDSPAPTLKN